MFSKTELQILNKIQTKTPTISLYLNTDQKTLKPESIRTNFRNLLKLAEKLFGEEQSKKIRRRFHLRLAKNAKGLVFFANPKEVIFYEYQLPCSVENAIYFEKNLHLTPLVKLLDEYERNLAVIFDRSKAKIFTVYLGKIEKPIIEIKTEFPGKHKKGGWSQARFARHIEDHLVRHLEKIITAIKSKNQIKQFGRIILGGGNKIRSMLKNILPPDLRKKIAGEINIELFAPRGKILSQIQKVGEKIEREEEKEKIKGWQRFLGKNSKSCNGLDKVIEAANQKRIYQIYLDLNLKKIGSKCFSCGSLNGNFNIICPVCGEAAEKADLIDELVQAVLAQNGKIEFVADNKELKKLGGVGARLRY